MSHKPLFAGARRVTTMEPWVKLQKSEERVVLLLFRDGGEWAMAGAK